MRTKRLSNYIVSYVIVGMFLNCVVSIAVPLRFTGQKEKHQYMMVLNGNTVKCTLFLLESQVAFPLVELIDRSFSLLVWKK